MLFVFVQFVFQEVEIGEADLFELWFAVPHFGSQQNRRRTDDEPIIIEVAVFDKEVVAQLDC